MENSKNKNDHHGLRLINGGKRTRKSAKSSQASVPEYLINPLGHWMDHEEDSDDSWRPDPNTLYARRA